jgi:NitT/TauT family transport system substrate-binding protein
MKPMSRSLFLGTIPMLGAATALPAFGQSQAPLTVRVGATANDTYAEAYYAQDMGFFTRGALSVEITTFTNGAAVSSAVASGALDVGISNPVQLGNAIGHGIPFAFLAGAGAYNTALPTTVLCVAKDGPIHAPKDFAGQTIAVSALKDLTDLAQQQYLEKNGVDPSTVKTIELPFAEMGPALARGTVAGAVISEPSLSASVLSGQARVFTKVFDAIAPHFLISVWFTTRDWYAKNTVAAKRYAAVMYQTANWANANRDQSAAILEKYSKISDTTTKQMARSSYAVTLNPQLIDPVFALAYKAKITDRLLTAASVSV